MQIERSGAGLQIPAAFTDALDGFAKGLVGLGFVCRTLRGCLDDDAHAAQALQVYLDRARDQRRLAPDAYETLIGEIDAVFSEELPTDWSEEIARTHIVGLEDTARHRVSPRAAASNRPAIERRAAPRSPRQALVPGVVLRDRFVLYSRLESGGSMGQIFKALDRHREEAGARNPWVAIKVVSQPLARYAQAREALRHEAASARRLSHPNIVRVFDFDRDGDHTFMTMEWLEGESLARLLDRRRGRPLARHHAMKIAEGLCRGLAHAHAQGLVHADVKPANLFVTPTGLTKLLDFGVARALRGSDDPELAGGLRGHTPEYASCEVLEGRDPMPQDDLFSLACVTYRMLAGQRVFGGRTALEAEAAGIEPAPIANLPHSQWRALARALAFRRADRFPDVTSFIAALKGPREELRRHDAHAETELLLQSMERWGLGAPALAAGLLLLAALALWWWPDAVPLAPIRFVLVP